MKSNQHIRKSLAALLLFVFCLSITPKEFLHSWFANHKDFQFANDYQNNQKDGLQHVTTAYFNCHCDNLVVESPFVQTDENTVFFSPINYITTSQKPVSLHLPALIAYRNLRGPPQSV